METCPWQFYPCNLVLIFSAEFLYSCVVLIFPSWGNFVAHMVLFFSYILMDPKTLLIYYSIIHL